MKFKVSDLIEVSFLDHYQSPPGWRFIPDEQGTIESKICTAVGYIVADNKHYIRLVMLYDEEKHGSCYLNILKSTIIKRRKID